MIICKNRWVSNDNLQKPLNEKIPTLYRTFGQTQTETHTTKRRKKNETLGSILVEIEPPSAKLWCVFCGVEKSVCRTALWWLRGRFLRFAQAFIKSIY